MKFSNSKGFTVLEVLIVVTVLSLLSVLFFWGSKNAYFSSRETLTKDFARNLNSKVEIYKIHVLSDGSTSVPLWDNCNEAIVALNKPVPGTDIIVLNDSGLIDTANSRLDWNKNKQTFICKH